ncbi:hypothetical protein M011DRAFT_396330 [Sporormia fimetaria CBS 119925]|uniref:NadR/Ttd14 AAA domain-containing protein n=1 Tax=Sporormia fimetaria CBS 119925 TaxID=1340428 RepID=A0A6A6VJW4_9PLEO|nr:hypothetical protein M011DRAFT_396330 [Sporormia fimetaria CBS 119925]
MAEGEERTAASVSRRIVYIIGAQCTGKTTLVNAVERKLNSDQDNTGGSMETNKKRPIIVRETARMLIKEKGFTREDLKTPSRAASFQQCILEAQYKAESLASANSTSSGYICDRSGLDPIVYAQLFAGKEFADKMLASPPWKELEAKMKAGIVILCEAGCSWLVDDGTRAMPGDTANWMAIDRTFRDLLAARGISYTVISKDMTDIDDRVQFVLDAMEAE